MKNWLYTASLGLVLALSTGVQATDKIAVVNIASLFQHSPQHAIVAQQLEKEFHKQATELQYMEHELQDKVHHLQRDGSTMKASTRHELEQSIITQRKIFAHQAQRFEHDNRRRQIEERNKILNNIQDVIQNIAIKQDYDIVINTTSVVYAKNNKDITADVMQQIK